MNLGFLRSRGVGLSVWDLVGGQNFSILFWVPAILWYPKRTIILITLCFPLKASWL